MKPRQILTSLSLFACTVIYCQKDNDTLTVIENVFDRNKTNYSFKYDLLSEILQVGLDRGILKGDQNDVSFKSTIYGLMVMFDKNYEIDKYYSKLKFQRNLELGGTMQMAEDNRINGFGASLKYAIINKRDLSYGHDYRRIADKVMATQQELAATIGKFLQAYGRDSTTTPEARLRLIRFLQENASIKDFNKFYEELLAIVGFLPTGLTKEKFAEIQTSIDLINKEYQDITREITKRPLLTFAAETRNSDNKWEFAKFKLEFVKGLGFVKEDEHPWDFYLGVFFDLGRDTLQISKNLDRSMGSLRGGINHVLIKRKNNQSFLEVLGGFEYNSLFDGKYVGEKNETLNAMFNLTFRIAPNLYIPIAIKYDPDKGDFTGQIRIKWDMIRDDD